MELVADGQARAFEVIFDRHSGAAFSLAYRMCGRRAMAEDVVQEAFLSLWRSGGRYDRRRGSVRTWILGVVHNRAIDAFRRGVVRESRNVPDDGLAEQLPARERTEVEVVRRDEADAGALGARGAAGRAAPGDRAGVLRRLQPQRDLGDAGAARPVP